MPEVFYHFAPASARENIASKGLLPSPGDDPLYPQLWLTRNFGIKRKGFSDERLDLYKVQADAVEILFDLGDDVTTLQGVDPEFIRIIETR